MVEINPNEKSILVLGHEIRRCPACDCLSVEIWKINGRCAVVCQNKDCAMIGPRRKRIKDCVDAWNTLPRRLDAQVREKEEDNGNKN